MVYWKDTIVPIIVAVITLMGTSLTFILSGLFRPNISVELLPAKDQHRVSIIIQNTGSAPAKNLKLTFESPHNITSSDIFGTENYTKGYANASSFELNIPRFVQGKGSLIRIVALTDAHSNITQDDHYTVFTTYDEGSDMTLQYILPRPPLTSIQAFDAFLKSPLINTAVGVIGLLTTAAGIIAALVQRYRRTRLGERHKAYAIHEELAKLGKPDESMNDIIKRLIDSYKEKNKE